ncbi:uncharacterized protein LOC134831952 [Culicoides brevitarsis]|uniref:uncharacterized protein LOC134831952 n=1 Tax=Culicoides brevitarsis TaxID=469753 RepID=UPI00307BB8A3
MEEIWSKVTSTLNLDATASQIWLEKLKERYNDTTVRHYHTEDEMLKSKLAYLVDQKPSVVLAVLFQYYELDSQGNSIEMNCQAFKEFCKDTALNDENLVQHVLRLLGDPSANVFDIEDDLNFLQDLDLVYLSSSAEDFRRQRELLRLEYKQMNDKQYNSMRLKFLETFLNVLPCIYSTTQFREQFEEAAKANITAEVEELKALV